MIESKPNGRNVLVEMISCCRPPRHGFFFEGDSDVDITIPECVDEIGAKVLQSTTAVRLLRIHSNVTRVASGAFAGSQSLRSLVWDCSSITAVPDSLCEDCPALEEVRLHRLTQSIGAKAFVNCAVVKQMRLPVACKAVGMYAFACSGITDILLPQGIVLGRGVFSNCKQLVTVVESGELKEIPEDTFQECTALTTCVVGSAGLIKRHAFYKCHKLHYLLVNKDVQYADGAFTGASVGTIIKTYQ